MKNSNKKALSWVSFPTILVSVLFEHKKKKLLRSLKEILKDDEKDFKTFESTLEDVCIYKQMILSFKRLRTQCNVWDSYKFEVSRITNELQHFQPQKKSEALVSFTLFLHEVIMGMTKNY